ncbi:MAG TPA: GspH/FimT family pseudopilin [Rhodocyclaceae bacterium]|jgi:type IV fimbrial biogenesis protein FimT|nr:GspH/FimT family pseudopilin [Rhodocyclaceae bacterium]HRQ46436.1 GspH/FimT family pseudopilin [Rhodocyclaceae bacterium]
MTRKSTGGVTLIELLVTLAVLAVMLGIALPSFADLIRDTRLTTAINSVHVALSYTRSESIKRGRRVTICTSANQLDCAPGIGWHRGWMAFDDRNGNGIRDAGETIMRVGAALPSGITITGNNPVRNYVSYVPSGTTRTIGGALQMGTITACSGGRVRQIVISATGRPRVVREGNC